MATHDICGREYARLSQIRAGDMIEIDAGFTCREAGPALVLADKDGRLCFACSGGDAPSRIFRRADRHMIDGQVGDDDDHLVGIYSPDPASALP